MTTSATTEGGHVTVTEDTTVELADHAVRLPKGLRLRVLDAKGGNLKVLDVDTATAVWIPARLVTRSDR